MELGCGVAIEASGKGSADIGGILNGCVGSEVSRHARNGNGQMGGWEGKCGGEQKKTTPPSLGLPGHVNKDRAYFADERTWWAVFRAPSKESRFDVASRKNRRIETRGKCFQQILPVDAFP